jgi:transglutaminase-like putative cysteine protease
MIGWIVGAAALAALAVGLTVGITGSLSLAREGPMLQVRLRRGRGPEAPSLAAASIDMGEGVITYLLLVAIAWLSALAVANSSWVTRIEVLPSVALLGAVVCLLLAKLCRRGTTYWLAAEVTAVLALFIATAPHTGWRVDQDFVSWVQAVRASLQLALLVAMVAAVWLAAAWLVFWTVRVRNVPVAIAPLVLAITFEVLDDPGQKGLTLVVALWLAVAAALAVRVHLAGLDRRWGSRASDEVSMSLGVHGARVTVVILVLAFLAPPLSSVDLSTKLFPGQKNNPDQANAAGTGNGPGSGFIQTGYTERVEPGGTIIRSQDAVLEVNNDLSVGVYWRGINLYAVNNGTWETGESSRLTAPAVAGADLQSATYQARKQVHGIVRVLGVPSRTLFFPGDPIRTSVNSQVRGDPQDVSGRRGQLLGALPIDGAYAVPPIQAGESYTVDASYSVASEDQLRAAGTNYPAEVTALTHRVGSSGSTRVDPRVSQLATQVVGAATNPYDQAKAIEGYLRANLKYQLQVDPPPRGTDPVSFFLFQSRIGYCEYFASSMGEMVRSLGIPVRLVNGYGPGSQNSDRELNVAFQQSTEPPRLIHAADAHTWVEVFFPSYGWVPFEPTPDPAYPALGRGVPLAQPVAEANPAPAAPAPAEASQAAGGRALLGPGIAVGALVMIVIVLLLAGRAVARGPGSLDSVRPAWRRLGWVGARLGVPRRDTDTPLEFSRRLADALPALGSEIDELGRAYSRDCYRQGGLDPEDLGRADRAWRRLRPAIIRALLTGRARPAAGAII